MGTLDFSYTPWDLQSNWAFGWFFFSFSFARSGGPGDEFELVTVTSGAFWVDIELHLLLNMVCAGLASEIGQVRLGPGPSDGQGQKSGLFPVKQDGSHQQVIECSKSVLLPNYTSFRGLTLAMGVAVDWTAPLQPCFWPPFWKKRVIKCPCFY